MEILSFQVNDEATALVLEITGAEDADTLNLWTHDTYKDYNKDIDISDKLNGSSDQTITISLSDINQTEFDGLYFIEINDDTTTISSLTTYLVRYEECILNKLSELEICDDCLKKESTSLINAQTLLTGLIYSSTQGFIEEAINIIKALNKYCSNECKTCGKYNNIINNTYYDYNSD